MCKTVNIHKLTAFILSGKNNKDKILLNEKNSPPYNAYNASLTSFNFNANVLAFCILYPAFFLIFTEKNGPNKQYI